MRVKGGFTTRRRHKRMLKLAKGFKGRRGKCYKLAKRSVQHGLVYAYRDRKVRKRDFRSLWITRINAGVRAHGLSYSKFVRGLKQANIELNRKMLAELAVHDSAAFAGLVEKARASLR